MTFEQFCTLISEISHVPLEEIKEDASFRDDLGIDSLQMVNVLVELAEKTGAGLGSLTDSEQFSTPKKLYKALYGGN
ncbi:acyl carrier protein [Oceanobacillus salinisoli]|uniref:acyl carrier protein n=1 Tax=Oceanobacillus salinisoli TaxID=2678611 RepID=UPI0012E1545B|nr:phosphopantetheine-binding protein [Oceanobacillus salinisoli]